LLAVLVLAFFYLKPFFTGKAVSVGDYESAPNCDDVIGTYLGSGTSEDPYQIENVYQLQCIFAKDLSADYILMNNISASATSGWNSGAGFIPIGNSSYMFTGSLNGSSFAVSDLYINRPSENNIGLFGYTNDSEISGLGLINVNISGGATDPNTVHTGAIAGVARESAVSDSYATGTIRATAVVGGLVGYLSISTIEKSYADVDITYTASSLGSFLGGLVGVSYNSIIENTYARGDLTGQGGSRYQSRVGGLVGHLVRDSSGQGYAGKYTKNSYSTGHVSGATGYIGGFVGFNYNPTVTTCYWDKETSGQTAAYGATNSVGTSAASGKTTVQMKQQATYSSWNFADIWSIDEGNAYPVFLSGESDAISPTIEIISPENTTYGNATQLVNISAADETELDTIWYNWNGTNMTYTSELEIEFDEGSNILHAWANDTSGNVNETTVTFNINLSDIDTDGLPDVDDRLLYNETNVTSSGIASLDIVVSGNTNVDSDGWIGTYDATFYDNGAVFANFTHNFTINLIDLLKVSVEKTSTGILLNLSGQLAPGEKKTMYIDDNSFVSLCVKDAEVASISAISDSCTGANETDFTTCLGNAGGVTINNIVCYDEGARIKVENLTYSAIIGKQASASASAASSGGGGGGCLTNWTCSEWNSCAENIRTRTCTKIREICYAGVKPDESQACISAGEETENPAAIPAEEMPAPASATASTKCCLFGICWFEFIICGYWWVLILLIIASIILRKAFGKKRFGKKK